MASEWRRLEELRDSGIEEFIVWKCILTPELVFKEMYYFHYRSLRIIGNILISAFCKHCVLCKQKLCWCQ